METRKILLKLSGRAFLGKLEYGIDPEACMRVVREIELVVNLGVKLAIVVGAGNIFKGKSASESGMERATADHIGMLGTVMNGLALQQAVEKAGIQVRLMSTVGPELMAEKYSHGRAIAHMDKGRVVIISGGSGAPFFSTDTAAAVRALELGCEAVYKGTNVDGIYTRDPKIYDDAVLIDHLNYGEAIEKRYEVMDPAAFTLCRDHGLPIVVFDFFENGNFLKIVNGDKLGTWVTAE